MKEAHYLTSANSKDNKPSTPLIQRVKALKYFTPLVVKCEYERDLRSNEHYLSSSENKAWKSSGLYGIWTHDLCDTSAVLYQPS